MPVLIAMCVFAAVTATVMAILQAKNASAVAAQERLERVAGRAEYADWQVAPRVALRDNRMSSISWMQTILADVDFARGLELTLTRADWNMRVSEFLAICLLGGGLGAFVGFVILGQMLFALVLGAFGTMVPVYVLRRAARKRIAKIDKQLVEMLVMMSNSLKAGFGLMQAVDQAARQLEAPIADELKQLRRDTQVGSSVEEAVVDFGRRIGSYDLEIVVTAVLVQRNVGGNLSEILDNVAHTIRERERIRGEVATLTAEGKTTGIIIGALPLFIAVLFTLLNRDYMSVLWTEPVGRIMVATAAVMETMGILAIRKIINIQI
jgi:tight adherence protein B